MTRCYEICLGKKEKKKILGIFVFMAIISARLSLTREALYISREQHWHPKYSSQHQLVQHLCSFDPLADSSVSFKIIFRILEHWDVRLPKEMPGGCVISLSASCRIASHQFCQKCLQRRSHVLSAQSCVVWFFFYFFCGAHSLALFRQAGRWPIQTTEAMPQP